VLTVGVNTYITILEIDDYMTYQNNTSWYTLPDAPLNPGALSKESYLIQVFDMLVRFLGGAPSVNEILKQAQKETVIYYYENEAIIKKRARDVNTGVERTNIGDWEEWLNLDNFNYIPKSVQQMLGDYILHSATNVFIEICD